MPSPSHVTKDFWHVNEDWKNSKIRLPRVDLWLTDCIILNRKKIKYANVKPNATIQKQSYTWVPSLLNFDNQLYLKNKV